MTVTELIVLATIVAFVIWSRSLYGADDAWWQEVRRRWWPVLHNPLKSFGGFALSGVGGRAYVGVVKMSEDDLEATLERIGFVRNPWAALKTRLDGQDVSEGSWVYRKSDVWYRPDDLAPMQLHVTVFERADGIGYDLYAHWEDNYWVSPFDHLDGANLSAPRGVEMMHERLDENRVSYFTDLEPDPIIEQDSNAYK